MRSADIIRLWCLPRHMPQVIPSPVNLALVIALGACVCGTTCSCLARHFCKCCHKKKKARKGGRPRGDDNV